MHMEGALVRYGAFTLIGAMKQGPANAGDIRNASMAVTTIANFDDPSAPLQRLLRLCGVPAGQTISVAGAGSLEVMIALCRAGYDRVECARRATCAGADETSHLLILTGQPETLGGLAARTLPLLRDGGVVGAWLERIEDDSAIRGALLVRGMEVITSQFDMAGGLAVAHRVRRRGRLALVS